MVNNMLSIFIGNDSTSFFWSRAAHTSIQSNPILLEGSFELDRLSGAVVKRVRLSSSHLFLIRTGEIPGSQPVEATASLSCMSLEPCTLRGKVGFVLRTGDCSETFLTNDSHEAKKWIHTLKTLCICTGFNTDFDILELLGQGTLSQVFLADEKLTGEQYAVKVIEKSKLVSDNHVKGVVREVSILRKLKHPSIVKLERVYEDEDKVYIVLERIRGQSILKKLERDERIVEEQALKITRKVLEVLDYLNSQQIVHRDIKPENILLNETEDSVTLIDFGLAVELQDDTMQTCGSPGYVAPEILCKRGASTKADVFSAGVLLYVMLSGRMPFGTKDQRAIIHRNRMGFISFPKEDWQNVSLHAVNLVLDMMTVDCWARPEASEVLNNFLFSPSTGPSSPFLESVIAEPPPFSLDEFELIHREKAKSKRICRSLKEIDDSLGTLPRRNSIPKSNIFVIDAAVLRKANSSQFS